MAVNLSKGQKVDLRKKDGNRLTSFCVGANWGAIEKKGLFGKKYEAVDLDLSLGTFDKDRNLVETIYFGNLNTSGIKHSGDDLVGDVDGDDGLDNEVIEVTLPSITANITQIVFVLNSYQGHDFATIPFASIRLYEGTPSKVKEVVATYNIANDAKFSGHVSMVLGKLIRSEDDWKFEAMGEAIKAEKLNQTLYTVRTKFL